MAERTADRSCETVLVPCARKIVQRKMAKDYHWAGAQENIGMLSESWNDLNSFINPEMYVISWLPKLQKGPPPSPV